MLQSELTLVPIDAIAPMATIETSEAIAAYSMLVAPRFSPINLNMRVILLLPVRLAGPYALRGRGSTCAIRLSWTGTVTKDQS